LKVFFAIYLFCLSAAVHAQFGQDNDVNLINGKRELLPYQNSIKADIKFDARRTFFQKQWIGVGGLRLGVEYRRIHRIGMGFYFLNTRIFDSEFDYDIVAESIEYDFSYNSIYYERALYFDRKWEFGSGIHLGGGRINVLYNPDGGNNRVIIDEIPFNTGEFSLYGEYNIFYWLGIGTGLGYRHVWGLDKTLRQSFSSPIFSATLQVKFIKLAKSFFNEAVKDEF